MFFAVIHTINLSKASYFVQELFLAEDKTYKIKLLTQLKQCLILEVVVFPFLFLRSGSLSEVPIKKVELHKKPDQI